MHLAYERHKKNNKQSKVTEETHKEYEVSLVAEEEAQIEQLYAKDVI
ncbi:11049_t:CDS:2 [Funneliformis mosseae]|uniref:11049_t:CDS:1 n=1 Tax=Funneliformis mosseae TaxID=27381 RepID=A0A9N9FFN7_FUNMO|nr:11049_t:CDS:2 [Funneliformis mosseae]